MITEYGVYIFVHMYTYTFMSWVLYMHPIQIIKIVVRKFMYSKSILRHELMKIKGANQHIENVPSTSQMNDTDDTRLLF